MELAIKLSNKTNQKGTEKRLRWRSDFTDAVDDGLYLAGMTSDSKYPLMLNPYTML